ncbi:hypothetical protein BH09SUM1_BH09SUM1_28440 [soil metagenome]
MNKIFAISFNTFKEAVRNRILYVLLFFSVIIMFGAWIASTLSIDDQNKIIRDFGVGAINIISLLIAVFVGIGLVYNDLDKKTIYTVVSKPISRWQFIVGKYFGLMLTIAVNVLIMTIIFAAVLQFRRLIEPQSIMESVGRTSPEGYRTLSQTAVFGYYIYAALKSLVLGVWYVITLGLTGPDVTNGLFATSLMTMMEMGIVVAFAVLFSSFSTPTLSAFLTVIIFIIGRLNQQLYLFAQDKINHANGGWAGMSGGEKVAYDFAVFCAYITPNLSIFDKRMQLGSSTPIPFNWMDPAYMAVYSTMVIFIAIMIFNRRNFK